MRGINSGDTAAATARYSTHDGRAFGRPWSAETEEMRQVAAAVSAARDDQCTVLLVEGEAGIGKSRLLSEAAQQLRRPRRHRPAWSGGGAGRRRHPVRRRGRHASRPATPSARRRSHARPGGPDQPRGPAHDTDRRRGAALDRGLLLDSFVTLVETLGRGRLLWWVVEDLHWSDTSSRDVLSYLIRAIGPAQLLVTMTVRTGEPWPDALSGVRRRDRPIPAGVPADPASAVRHRARSTRSTSSPRDRWLRRCSSGYVDSVRATRSGRRSSSSAASTAPARSLSPSAV